MKPKKIHHILFLCTANSARSIMAEGLLNHLGEGRFLAFSAGSHPGLAPNPHALLLLQKAGHETGYLYSKSWDEFATGDAPQMDLVITVCDQVEALPQPHWPGHPGQAHWDFTDPASCSEPAQAHAFACVFAQIRHRIELLVSLPDEKICHLACQPVQALPIHTLE